MSPEVAVGGIILDRDPESGEAHVVLVRRGQAPSMGRWSLPGGRVERGERLIDALKRELYEETGLEVAVGALVEVVEVIEPSFHYVILDYLCEKIGGVLRAASDVTDVAHVACSKLDRYDVTQAVKNVVERAIALRISLDETR